MATRRSLMFIFFLSSILFGASVVLYCCYALSGSVPFIHHGLKVMETSSPTVVNFLGMAGIIAGLFGVLPLISFFTGKYEGRVTCVPMYVIYLPPAYGFVSVAYILLTAGFGG